MRACSWTTLLAAVAVVDARVFEAEVLPPAAWRVVDDAPAKTTPLTLQFALTPATDLAPLVLDVATPGSPRFHDYLSPVEIARLVTPEAADETVAWAEDAFGAAAHVETCLTGDWVRVDTTVGAAELALATKFAMYESQHTRLRKLHAVASYVVPDDLPIDFVAGLHTFLAFGRKTPRHGEKARAFAALAKEVTPSVLDTLYSLQDASTVEPLNSTNSKTSQAVVQFGDNFNEDDLQSFFAQERPVLVGQTINVVGKNRGDHGIVQGEANLDTQYVSAVGAFVNTTDYALTLSSDPAGFLSFTYMVSNDTDPPLVHSISYGEYGGNYDNATVQRFSFELQKLGLLGITVTLASGDNGVGCNKVVSCGSGVAEVFDFPSSPFITMVGATQLQQDGVTEIGATLSSGGFSDDYARPAWQADAVAGYLDILGTPAAPMPSESFNGDGTRAYPDISAIGENVQVVIGGRLQGIGGTSCSSPMIAGLIASLNAQLLAADLPPMGFINPFLYAHPDMFTDILGGSNPYECCDGFTAAAGWDPVTGLGTPKFDKMLEYALGDSMQARGKPAHTKSVQ